MNAQTIEQTIAETLTAVLGIAVSSGEKIIREKYPVWDSLKHIEIIFALEGALGISFSEQEIAAITNSDDLITLVETKLET